MGCGDAAEKRQDEPERHLGHSVRVTAGRVADRYTARRRGLEVDLVQRVATYAHESYPRRCFEHLLEYEIGFHDEHGEVLVAQANAQLRGVVEQVRIQPALVHNVHALAEAREVALGEWRQDQSTHGHPTFRRVRF